MKFRKLTPFLLCGMISVGCSLRAYANEVLLTADHPTEITFRVAHQNLNGQPVFGGRQNVLIDKERTIGVALKEYDLAGIVIDAVNGHEIPPYVNQFDKPKQCSMTTNKMKSTGELKFETSVHKVSCSTYGGIFG